ncbi:MAG: DUF3782 domain-containing protein [Gammaproteobacteria bacterium HGW-Gammaproteobacteria-3]|nr:MAG: DUF3782 domain-containing protein [Gammaproteobacteria bacterium HGW-Gammaproteobacteria-3]
MSLSQPTLDDVWKLFRETDRQFKETDRKLKELSEDTDRKIKQVSLSVGRLENRLGDFVEEMVRPAAVRLFQERGIAVHEVHQNVKSQRGDEGVEIDLLVVNDTDMVAIECKSHLSIDDVNAHINRLEKLKRLLPAYGGKQVMGAVTGMVIPGHVAEYAEQQGLFVITQTGAHLRVSNASDFQAKIR